MSVISERTAQTPAAPDTFESRHPATGELVGRFPVDGPEQVRAAVEQARAAAIWWQQLGWGGRAQRLRGLRRLLVQRREELVELIHQETGKPRVDAWIEHTLVLEHLSWAARNARRVLGPHRMGGTALLANIRPILEYEPLGVIGVIGPWNYPLFTPMGSIGYALAAGNAVVFKPSEYTPAVGRWLADTMAEITPEQPVLQVVTGFGDTGAALCRAGVDKVAFTGSAPTGRKIMAACAETLTPVLLELGGKDAMIVDADADLGRAARAALWGGVWNAGQACIGIERVYVVDPVYDRFVDALVRVAAGIRASTDSDAALGPITMPRQLDVIREQVEDALGRGARAVVGGRESIRPPFIDPIVLVDVPEDARLLREETFGPVLPVLRVPDADAALVQANSTTYGLGAAVFGRSRALELARRIRSGMVGVNTVLTYAGFPSLPFGGVGDSGFGRIHGADGLKEFTRAKAMAQLRFGLPVELLAFDRPAWLPGLLQRFDELRYRR